MTDLDLQRLGAHLPFAEAVPRLQEALRGPGIAVVQAPPGTGKTTLAPPAAAQTLDAGPDRRIVVVQPRRVAARAAARRLAHLSGTRLGELSGLTVRGERETGRATAVEFVTPGVLVGRLLRDPELPGTAAVVLDEVHERGLETDLLLGMLLELRQLREDVALIAMSATLDAGSFAGLIEQSLGLPDVPIVDSRAVEHPLEVRWAPGRGHRLDERGVSREFLDHVARTAEQEHRLGLAQDPELDALVFLPGAGEVAHVAARLRESSRAEVLELHGRIPAAEQDRAVAGRGPEDGPRIVVSTALAESSLTVPGVRLVVDAGLSREPRRDAVRRMSGLVTVSASRASGRQRAGRAARTGPGTVVRCYDESTWAAMPERSVPEIRTADLTSAALVLACWGTPGGEGMSLLDPPAPRALADAHRTLRSLEALDDELRPTGTGRRLAGLPVDPRWGRALLDGAALAGARSAADVVAAASDDIRTPDGDLVRLLSRLRRGDHPAAGRWRAEARRLRSLAGAPGGDHGADDSERGGASRAPADTERPEPGIGSARDEAGLVVGLAFPDRIARRMDRAGEQWLLASGTRAGLPAGSPLAHEQWLAVADITRSQAAAAAGTGALIRSAAGLERETAEQAAGSLHRRELSVRFVDGRARARDVESIGAIELSATPARPSPQQAAPAIRRALEEQGLELLAWPDPAAQLRARLAACHRHLGAPWPAMDDESLAGRAQVWLGPELDALARGASVRSIDTASALRRLLPWPEASRLDELAPQRLTVPSGASHRLIWPQRWEQPEVALSDAEEHAGGGRGQVPQPIVRVKLQECFGLAESPRLLDGRLPVLFHLLSPAGRELAITADLASFWSGPYREVRAEMRGRYPKHPWPEDPWSAQATARTRRRG
ncbi:ATP-dependent helicase HrpB [Kocuria palustris]|uniref:ATP-dependent helicase HrpB n=1 Tax=Kocuria palustris TaxID=71999 RepID=UPI0011A879F4|nr:ATP-dependent helicase HrpB [Kocuria palustris]